MKKLCHIFVSGHVQGVFFRAHARDIAKSLSISGWVRNLPDGRVEIVAEGEEEDIKRFIEWAKKGPERARVSDVKVEYKDELVGFKGFEIRYI